MFGYDNASRFTCARNEFKYCRTGRVPFDGDYFHDTLRRLKRQFLSREGSSIDVRRLRNAWFNKLSIVGGDTCYKPIIRCVALSRERGAGLDEICSIRGVPIGRMVCDHVR